MTCLPEDMPYVVSRRITRINARGRMEVVDTLLREEGWNIFLNGEKIETLFCLPADLEALAVGHLFYKGLCKSLEQIVSVRVDAAAKAVHVEAGSDDGAPGRAPLPGEVSLSPGEILRLQRIFDDSCSLFHCTGAAHSCALADKDGLIIFMSDIARHNALDKVVGEMLRTGEEAGGKALIFSGRLALDMLEKSARSGVRLLIAPGAPSLPAVERAERAGITLLGFVRSDNINIYTHPERVTGEAL